MISKVIYKLSKKIFEEDEFHTLRLKIQTLPFKIAASSLLAWHSPRTDQSSESSWWIPNAGVRLCLNASNWILGVNDGDISKTENCADPFWLPAAQPNQINQTEIQRMKYG